MRKNISLFRQKKCEIICQFGKKSYLCIRFRSKTGWERMRKSSLIDLHKQTSSTRSELSEPPKLGGWGSERSRSDSLVN